MVSFCCCFLSYSTLLFSLHKSISASSIFGARQRAYKIHERAGKSSIGKLRPTRYCTIRTYRTGIGIGSLPVPGRLSFPLLVVFIPASTMGRIMVLLYRIYTVVLPSIVLMYRIVSYIQYRQRDLMSWIDLLISILFCRVC